jgi:hypothetical protein
MGVLTTYFEKHEIVVGQLAAAAELIPQDKINWKPCEKSLPWLFLIHHTSIGRRHVIYKCIRGEKSNYPHCFGDPALQVTSPTEAARMQWETWNELKSFLESQPGDFALQTVTFPKGFDLTVERLLWMGYDENVHHRGQAWIYTRMNGITPPTVWGTEGREYAFMI